MPKTQENKGSRTTMGYPNVEKLLDTEDFDGFNKMFAGVYSELAEVSKKKKGLKKSRDAQKAMKAIDLMIALMEELLKLKYRVSAWWEQKKKEKGK